MVLSCAIKIKWENSFIEDTREAAAGVIARDHQGELVGGKGYCVQAFSAEETEVRDVLEECSPGKGEAVEDGLCHWKLSGLILKI